MQLKHTPGPWAMNAIYAKGKISHWGINGVNKTGDTFTSGRIVDVQCLVPNHDCPTQEANARLIAAAPELLEACKACADGIDELMGLLVKDAPHLLPKDITSEPWATILKARAVITKATT